MDEVFLISSGHYSDYGVSVVVIGTEELAEQICAAMNDKDDSYEAHFVEKRPVLSEMPVQRLVHYAQANAGAKNVPPWMSSNNKWPWEIERYGTKLDQLYVQEYTNGTVAFRYFSFDAEKAMKCVSDGYHAYRANNPKTLDIPLSDELPF
jgi:hypothetical protein